MISEPDLLCGGMCAVPKMTEAVTLYSRIIDQSSEGSFHFHFRMFFIVVLLSLSYLFVCCLFCVLNASVFHVSVNT